MLWDWRRLASDNITRSPSPPMPVRWDLKHRTPRAVCKQSTGRVEHNFAVNDIIWRALVKADIPSSNEPPGLLRDDDKRPDGATLVLWDLKGQVRHLGCYNYPHSSKNLWIKGCWYHRPIGFLHLTSLYWCRSRVGSGVQIGLPGCSLRNTGHWQRG